MMAEKQTVSNILALQSTMKLTVDDLGNSVNPQVADQIGVLGGLVHIIDTSQVLDLTSPGSLVQSSPVDLLTPFQRSSNVDQEVVAATGADDLLLESLSGPLVRSGGSGDDGGTGLCKLGRDETDSLEVDVLLLGSDSTTNLGVEV